jgi:hypothetical protein
VRKSLELRLTLSGPSNAQGLARLRSLSLDPASLPFVPQFLYSCEVLDRGPAPFAADLFARPNSPVREPLRQRNLEFAAAAFGVPRAVSGSNALLVCKPYATSTNYAFIFRTPYSAKDDSGLASLLWPGKKLLQTGHNGRVIWYYKEQDGRDDFNYLCRRGDRLLVADSLKVAVACLESADGNFRLQSSETFAAVWRTLKDPWRTFYVFSTMKWANTALAPTDDALAAGFKDFSSLVLFTVAPSPAAFPGASIDIRSQPLVKSEK